jgi:hypothetical protein
MKRVMLRNAHLNTTSSEGLEGQSWTRERMSANGYGRRFYIWYSIR